MEEGDSSIQNAMPIHDQSSSSIGTRRFHGAFFIARKAAYTKMLKPVAIAQFIL